MNMDIVVPFGKYKGMWMSYIYETDRSYVRWLSENCDRVDIRMSALYMLDEFTNNKVEEIVKDALVHRGYCEAEAIMFIKSLKKSTL
jgi:hypothetical protein